MFSLVRAGLPRIARPIPEPKPVIRREGSFEQVIETKPFEGRRASTGLASIDKVLGRNEFGRYIGQTGISRQGVYLISGASGLGKTRLLYEWLAQFRRDGIRCAFISAEEQTSKIHATIIELGLLDDLGTMSTKHTKDFDEAMSMVVEADMEIVVVDSLNKIKSFSDNTKGEAAKVHMLNRMHEDAWRDENKPRVWLVVSQMTKDGELRGSEELIHDSDATLLLEKGLGDQIEISMPDKNRFGSHGREKAKFRMNDRGKMVEIKPGGNSSPATPMLPFTQLSERPPAVVPPPTLVLPVQTPVPTPTPPPTPAVSDVIDAELPTPAALVPAPPPAAPSIQPTQPDSDFRPPDDSPANGPPFKTETPLVAAARALNGGRAFEGLLATTRRRREARERGHG